MEEDVFQSRSYGFQELAQAYNPDITPDAATRRLKRWLRRNPDLYEELKQQRWIPEDRILTPAQVQTIIDYLGEP